MNKISIFTITVIVCIAITALSQKYSNAVTTANQDKWEYGVYQVNEGEYAYEWINNTKHVYAPNQQAFFEKLGAANMLVNMEGKYINTSPPFPTYLVDIAFLNYLGEQGWELVEASGFEKNSNHVFTFKRLIQ